MSSVRRDEASRLKVLPKLLKTPSLKDSKNGKDRKGRAEDRWLVLRTLRLAGLHRSPAAVRNGRRFY